MADAFRGLTLRIGADTRPLNSAISSITKTAGQAQKQMNRLSKALNFDGSNAALMQSRIDLMGDKALLSARAINKIKTAMAQAAAESKKLDGTNLRELAERTTKAHSATQNLRDEYNSVDAQLAHVTEAAARAAKTMEKFKDISEAVEYVKMLKEQMRGMGPAAEWATNEFNKYLQKASETGNINAKFGQQKGDFKALIETVGRLTDRHKELNAEYDRANRVQGFRAMKAELQAYMSEVKQAAAETARFQTELHMLGTGNRLSAGIADIKRMEEAAEKATAHAKVMSDAYQAFPKSLDAAVNKIQAVKAAEAALKAQLDSIESTMDKLRMDPAFDKMAEGSAEAYTKASKLESVYSRIASAVSIAEARVEELRKQQHALDDSGNVGTDEYKKLAAAIDKAEDKASTLRAKLHSMDDDHATAALTLQMKDLKAQAASAKMKIDSLHASVSKLRALSNIGRSMREFGFGMYASVTPALMMVGRYAIQAAEDFDSAYRDMRKTVNGEEEDFERLKDAALDYSTTHVTSADTLMEIEAMGGQLGIQVENLEAFAQTVSNLDIATNMEADDIAEQLGKMATVMGMSVDDYDNFGDALVRLGNNMPAMESDIMTVTTRFMGMGKVVGMSADQMLAWSTAAVATGQKPEAAGSAMQRFIAKMETAVTSGGESLEQWASIAGMSADEFAQAFGNNASDAMFSFIEGLGRIQTEGGSVNQTLQDLKINNVRDKQLLEGLAMQMANTADEGNVLADALRLSSEAWRGEDSNFKGKIEAAGDAAREAGRKSEGFSGEMQKMRNNAQMLAVTMSEGATPMVKGIGDAFSGVSQAVAGLPTEVKSGIVGFMGMLAAVGPLNVGLGTMLQSLEAAPTVTSKIQGGFVSLAAKLNQMNVETEAGMKANLGFQKVLTTLGSTKGMLGLAGAGIAIKLIADNIANAIDKQQKMEKSTKGLSEATSRAFRVNEAWGGNLDEYSQSARKSAMSVDELTESTASMVDRMNERSSAAENDISKLKAAQQVVDRYMNTDMSGDMGAQTRFRAAVDAINQITGSQYQVIDILNGKLADEQGQLMNTTGAVDQYIAAKEKAIRTDMLMSQLADVEQTIDDAAASYTEAKTAYDQFMRDNADFLNDNTIDPLAKKSTLEREAELQEAVTREKAILDEATKARDKFSSQLDATVASSDAATVSIDNLARSNGYLSTVLSDDEMNTFVATLQKGGMTVNEFGDINTEKWADIVMAWRSGGGELSTVLEQFGIKARSIGQMYSVVAKEAQGNTNLWKQAIKETGLSGDELATKLDGAGISAQTFASLSTNSFNALYQTTNGNFERIAQAIQLVDAANISPKQIKVDSEGVLRAGNQVIDLDNLTVGDKHFRLLDDGTLELVQEQVDELDGEDAEVGVNVEGEEQLGEAAQEAASAAEEIESQEPTMTVNVEEEAVRNILGDLLASSDTQINASINFSSTGADEVNGQWESLKGAVEAGAKGKVEISDNTSEVKGHLDGINNYSFNPKTVHVSVGGGALDTLSSISSYLDTLDGKSATTYVYVKRVSSSSGEDGHTATGAIFNSKGKIPLNAAGALNGIVTSAMMTNIGWVGEAGAEAVFHMRNAGGAVVPLSNRRYVRPFARAVATEMGGNTSVVHNHNTYYVNANAVTDERVISAVETVVDRASQFQEAM